MLNLKLVIFCLPWELPQYSGVVDRLLRQVLPDMDFRLDVVTHLHTINSVDWDKSEVTEQEIIRLFENETNRLRTKYTVEHITNKLGVEGCVSARRDSIINSHDVDFLIWLDTDIVFPDSMLYYLLHTCYTLKNNDAGSIITPETVRLWDSTWDCLTNSRYLSYPHGFERKCDPYSIMKENAENDVNLIQVYNTIPGQPKMKFAGGWFTCISTKVFSIIGNIPDSFGHYGLEDTWIMHASEKYKNIQQWKMEGMIVCENYYDRKEDIRIYKKNRMKEMGYCTTNNSFVDSLN